MALAAASAAFVTHSFAAKSTLVPEVVGEDERVLSEANALLQGAQRITIFLGPALAGVLIAAIGAANVLVLDALSFALGFLIVLTFVPPVGRIEQDEESRGLGAGFRFLARDSLAFEQAGALLISAFFFGDVPSDLRRADDLARFIADRRNR